MAIQKLQQVHPDLVEKMAGLLSSQTPEEIQNQLGIGINTWTKLRKGQAIRRSVALRLIERLRHAS
jgi:hypothetical protein